VKPLNYQIFTNGFRKAAQNRFSTQENSVFCVKFPDFSEIVGQNIIKIAYL
jgi:hypothetical protein